MTRGSKSQHGVCAYENYKGPTFIFGFIEPLLVDDGVNGNSSLTAHTRKHDQLTAYPLCPLVQWTPYPVCLSPMMSSLCPLPMGTRLSTALMPVCIGSRTEIRGMMLGAFVPTRARLSVTIAPWEGKEARKEWYRLCCSEEFAISTNEISLEQFATHPPPLISGHENTHIQNLTAGTPADMQS